VQVYAYVRDGILVVSLHYDTADTREHGPFAVYDESCIPTVIKAGESPVPTVIDAGDIEPVWTALPEDAATEADARDIREAYADEPEQWPAWVLPAWVYGG
jgi:hypothetical protein